MQTEQVTLHANHLNEEEPQSSQLNFRIKSAFDQELGVLHTEYQQFTGLCASVELGHLYFWLQVFKLEQLESKARTL